MFPAWQGLRGRRRSRELGCVGGEGGVYRREERGMGGKGERWEKGVK